MANESLSIGAVVAAAGLSSRMGSFKPLLPINGIPVIELCVRNLLNAGVTELVVVTGFRGHEIQSILSSLPVKFVHNKDYADTQMFDSIRLGLSAFSAPHDRVFITPGDIPLVSSKTLLGMIQAEGDFVSPVYCGISGHPVLLASRILPQIIEFSGNSGLRGAIASCRASVCTVETNDVGITLDLDTPEDYSKVLEKAKVFPF